MATHSSVLAWRIPGTGESDLHIGAIVAVRETFEAESETADLWQPKWNEDQTAVPTAGHLRWEGIHREGPVGLGGVWKFTYG